MSLRSVFLSQPFTAEECAEWVQNNRLRNPRTGRTITTNGRVYNDIRRQCEQFNLATPATQANNQNSPEERFLTSYRRQLESDGISPPRAEEIGRSLWRGVQRSLTNGTVLHNSIVEQVLDHVDENIRNSLLTIHSPATHVAPVAQAAPAAPTVPVAPQGAPTAPVRGSPPQVLNTELGPISRHEAERFIASRLRLGFPTYIRPVGLGFADFTPENMPIIQSLCDEFGLSTTLTPNLPNAIRLTTTRTARTNSLTLHQLDYYIAHRIRKNLEVENLGRPVTRSLRNGTIYQELVGLALRYGLDLNHIYSRMDGPSHMALPNPPNSHAKFVEDAIRDGVFTRFQQNTVVVPETQNGPYQNIRSIPKSTHKASVSSPSEEASIVVTKITYRDKVMILGFKKPTTAFPFNINQQIRLVGFQPDSYNGTHTIVSMRNESHLPISSITVTIDNLQAQGPVIKRGSIFYDAKIEIFPTCAETLSNIVAPFKKTANKLKLICNSLSKQCTSLDEKRMVLWRELAQYPTSTSRVFKAAPEYCIASLFRFWKAQSPSARATYMLVDKELLYVTYIDQSGVGDGVRRSFIQRVQDEFLIHGIFAPSTGETSERHFINPDFTPSKSFKQVCGMTFDSENDYVLFYEFIGRLLGFVLMNDMGLSFHLSYSILAHMIYKHEEITNDDYMAYGMYDFQDEFRSYINLMRNPEHIEYSYLSFNSEFDLRRTDDEVDKTNFVDYIQEKCKYRMLHKIFSNEQKPNAIDTYPRFKGLVKGFGSLRKFLRNNKITIPVLDKLLTFGTVSTFTCLDLIENIQRNMAARHVEATDNMISIIRDDGETFPYDVIGENRPATKSERRKHFLVFIERLLMFWSSYKRYSSSMGYFFIVKPVKEFDAARRILAQRQRPLTENERMNMLPESHTCFVRIDIPDTYHDNRDVLYKKLVQSAYFMEVGVGNHGGGKRGAIKKR